MNSEQLRLFINGAFGNEANAKGSCSLAPYLRQNCDEIRALIDLLQTRAWQGNVNGGHSATIERTAAV